MKKYVFWSFWAIVPLSVGIGAAAWKNDYPSNTVRLDSCLQLSTTRETVPSQLSDKLSHSFP